MINYLLVLLLGLSQILIIPNLSFRWCKEMSAQVLILLTISLLIWKKNKWVSAFLIWSTMLFFITKSYIVNDIGQTSTYSMNILSFLNFINIILFGLFYYVLHELKLNKNLIYKTLCFLAVFESAYVILQLFQIDQFFYNFSLATGKNPTYIKWPVGTWANEALISWCIALCSPFLLAYKELRFKLGYGLCFLALLATKATFGLLAFVIGFLFWLWFKHRKLAILLIISLLIIISILYIMGKLNYYLLDTHRFLVWKKSVMIWKQQAPITGIGHGSYRLLFWNLAPEFMKDGMWFQAHNEYVQILFEQGIVGLFIILGLIWTTFLKFIKHRRGLVPIVSLLVFAIISISGFPMRTAMGVIPLFALVLFEKELEEK